MANHPGRAPRAPMVGAKADLKPLGRVIRMLFQDYPAMLIAVMACIIISAVVGILPAIYIETITSYIEDGLRLGWDGVSGKILHALVTMVCIYLAGLACTAVYTQLMAHVTQGFLHKLRTRMFAGMQKLPIRYFDQNSRGDIMSYYTNDIDTLRQLVSQAIPSFIQAGAIVLCVLAIMLYYSILMTLVLLLGVVAMIFVAKKVGGGSARFFLRQQKSVAKTEGYIQEMMNGQKVVKVFCHEDACLAGFDEINDALCDDSFRANAYANILGPIIGNIGNVLYVTLALVGGVFLLVLGLISWHTPVAYLGGLAVLELFYTLATGGEMTDVLYALLSGGVILGAFFMATDYVTSPVTRGGQWIYAAFIGILTAVFRLLGSTAEGVSYAIVLGNILVPLIERMTMPKPPATSIMKAMLPIMRIPSLKRSSISFHLTAPEKNMITRPASAATARDCVLNSTAVTTRTAMMDIQWRSSRLVDSTALYALRSTSTFLYSRGLR